MKKAKLAALFFCALALAVPAFAQNSAKDECSKIPTPSLESAVGDWRLGNPADSGSVYMKVYPDGTWVSVMANGRSDDKIYRWTRGKARFQYGMLFLELSSSGKSKQLKFNEADWDEESGDASGYTVSVQKDRIYLSAMVALGGHTGIVGTWAQYRVDGTPESGEIERIAVTFDTDGNVLVTDYGADSWDAPFEKADDDQRQTYRLEDGGRLILSSDGEDTEGRYLIIDNYLFASDKDPAAEALVRIPESDDPITSAFDGTAPRYEEPKAAAKAEDDDDTAAEDADEAVTTPAPAPASDAAPAVPEAEVGASLPSLGFILSTQNNKSWISLDGSNIESVSLGKNEHDDGRLTSVRITLSKRGQQTFVSYAEDHVGETLKVVVNGELVIDSMPISERIDSSIIELIISGGEEKARAVYRALIDISAQD